ncbi:MAG TPA: PQQ-binding-like beta-propeller repeat protein [Planctomycetota bacterium]|nr:PQQ-binding-like beta-propeller repeat protein [Planctomycetota bacterium]
MILFTLLALLAQDSWTQFRGPGARGVAEDAAFPDKWSATENVAWKTDLPGRGWSSPVVWGGRIFLTTVVSSGESEPPKKGLYFGGDRPQPPKSSHEWWVYCLDLETGKTRWKQKVHEGEPKSAIHIKNSFASETPIVDGERVYFHFGNVGLFAFDLDGKEVWTKRFEPQKTRFGWGTAASPALHGDRLYVVSDNEEKSWLLALEKRTGKEVWRVDRDEKSNWSTPYVWESGTRAEIVTPGSGKVRSYDLDGKLLWWLEGMSSITIATPYAEGDLLYVTSGYVGSPLKPIYAIKPGGAGDLSLPRGGTSSASIAWCDWKAAPYNPTTLLYQGRLYALLDRGMLSAYDGKTGKPLYERERIADSHGFTASPWAAKGKVYALDEDGVTFVFEAGLTFKPLHSNRLAADDMGMATPAIAGNRLLIRTSARLYCIR